MSTRLSTEGPKGCLNLLYFPPFMQSTEESVLLLFFAQKRDWQNMPTRLRLGLDDLPKSRTNSIVCMASKPARQDEFEQ